MGSKLNVYNLGEKGVNVTTSPIHLEDGELTSGQNALFDPKGEEGGLRQRDGMTKLNTVAAGSGGAIKGVISVPLPIAAGSVGSGGTGVVDTMYASLGSADANTFLTSTDGTTWTPTTTPSAPRVIASGGGSARYLSFQRKLWYPGDQYVEHPAANSTPPIIRTYNGVQDIEVVKVPYSPTSGANATWIEDMCAYNGQIAFSVLDYGGTTPNVRGRVFLLNPYTYQITQVGNAFGNGVGENTGGAPTSGTLCSYGGYLWAGTYSNADASATIGKVWRIRAGIESTWTLDHTTDAGQGDVLTIGVYRGELFIGTWGEDQTPAAEAALVKRRTTAGVWAVSDTGAVCDDGSWYTNLVEFEDLLYAGWYGTGGAGEGALIRVYDGSSWSTAYDVEANIGVQSPMQALSFGGHLYWVIAASSAGATDGAILKKASGGGAWSIVKSGVNVQGMIGWIRTEV